MYSNTQTPGANLQSQNFPGGYNPMQTAMNPFQQQQTARPAYGQNPMNNRPATMPQSTPMNSYGMNPNMNPNMPMGMNMPGMSTPGRSVSSPYSNMQPVRVDMQQQQQQQQQQPNQWPQSQMYGMNQQPQMSSQPCYNNNPYQSQMNTSSQQPQQVTYRPQ